MNRLRNHLHVLLIVPLVVIVMTWPILPELFKNDGFWAHNPSPDVYHRIWDAWHIGKALAGEAELWRTTDMFHPQGASLVFQHFSFPHALLLLALGKAMPTDSAYNLLFLLILCFNGFCGYVLIRHLLKDKWAALYGAVVVVVGISFSHSNAVPDLACIGTMPLTLYFFHRALSESRIRFAALAGVAAGVTAFIGMYTFAFILLSAALYAAWLLPARWRQREFWRQLLLFATLCAAIGGLRIYPIVADAAARQEGMAKYDGKVRSNDALEYFVHSGNPFTRRLLHSIFNVAPDAEYRGSIAYLGYLNLFFLACALRRKMRWKDLIPWFALFVFFALMRLGDILTVNGMHYIDIVLPHRVLVGYFPALFGQIGYPDYYLYGLVTPLALCSSFGLAALIRGRSEKTRALASLAAVVVVALEFYAPISGLSLPKGATAYIDWLKTEPEDPIKLINLPRQKPTNRFVQYVQSLTGYPIAYGYLWRNRRSAAGYSDRNLLLREWQRQHSGHCFGRQNEYQAAVDDLLADGFSHIVLHLGTERARKVQHSFIDLTAAYDDGLVRIYRLRDMRLGCQDLPPALASFDQFLQSPWGARQPGESLLSFHPRDPIDGDDFAYLDAGLVNRSNWGGLLHLYIDQGAPSFQTAAAGAATVEDFTERDQVIYVVYDSRNIDAALMSATPPLDQYLSCGRLALEDGWAVERLLRHEFSCALFSSPAPLQVDYDNGARLENALVTLDISGEVELQMRWGAKPAQTQAVSAQFFDAAGNKVHNQDFVVGRGGALARHRLDISALEAGNYAVKLILYNFDTGKSVSGKLGDTGLRFERALQIATIERS